MRFSRLMTMIVALVAVVGMSLSLATVGAEAAAKKTRSPLTLSAGEIRNTGKFQVHGQVGHYKRKVVYLQQKKRGQHAFHNFKKKRTGTGGRFKIKFDGPTGSCYRIKIPGDRVYKKRVKKIGCIVAA